MDTSGFVERVEREMSELGSERAMANLGDQFAVWFGSEILGFEVGLVAEQLHIGASGDEKSDLGIAEEDVPIRIIAQCKFSKFGAGKFNKDTVDEVKNARDRAISIPTMGNQKRQEFSARFNASEQKPERLLCVGFGSFTPEAFEYAVANKIIIYDLHRIHQEWLTLRDPARLSMPKLVSIPADKESLITRGKEPSRTFITTMSTKTLYKMVEEFGLGLFSENFRYKLPSSARSDAIALKTKETLEKEPERFLERNNGLTFVCEHAHWDLKTIQAVAPQIVNGCQTSYAIHEWYQQRLSANQSLDDLTEGEVTVKVIEAGSDNALKIAEATNRQNPISARDLHSNLEVQKALAHDFNEHDPKIFFETREGAWSAIEAKHNTALYRVPSFQRFRVITNEVAGQIMLAFIGFPHWSKDRKKAIWEDDALNKAIFGINTPNKARFTAIRPGTPVVAVVDSIAPGASCFIQDALFGYAILQYLYAIKLKIYPEKLKLWTDPNADPIGRIVQNKDYFDYWEFHFAALVNFIITAMMQGDRAKIQEARQKLVGNDMNLVFAPPAKRAPKFKPSPDAGFHEILEMDKDDKTRLGNFSQWFNSIDGIFYSMVDDQRKSGDFKNLNYFFYKQESTFRDAINRASKWLGSKVERDLRFPLL